MSYHIYTTPGIILKRTPFGEANILLHILTNDLGLIIASARSARLSVSKLRPALQEYTLITLSCIKGKNGWKITNVVSEGSFFFGNSKKVQKTLSQITSVLIQMIQGEIPHKEIFQIVRTGFEFVKNIPENFISDFEVLILVRILKELGYMVSDSNTEEFFEETTKWDVGLLEKVRGNKKILIEMVNKALKASHL